MANTTALANKSGGALKVYPKTVARGTETDSNISATIAKNELFILDVVPTDDSWTTLNVIVAKFNVQTKVWDKVKGWIYNVGSQTPAIYEAPYGSSQTVHIIDQGFDITGQVFDIIQNTQTVQLDVMAADGYLGWLLLKPGDAIMVLDGKNDEHVPTMLKISAYRTNGSWFAASGSSKPLAVQTGILEGANFLQSVFVSASNF